MDFVQACFLFFAAWISGLLNSVAGGGGLIIFPALIVTGLPAINANATSTLASSPGYIASISAYRDKLQTHQQLSWFLGSVSIAGGIIGATLLLHTPTAIFNKLVPYLMLIAIVSFTLRGCLKSAVLCHAEERSISVYVPKPRFFVPLHSTQNDNLYLV